MPYSVSSLFRKLRRYLRERLMLFGIIVIAISCIIVGILFPFIDWGILDSNYDSAEYITALFSLAGILFFCAALTYQIREYKLQVDELRRSVEAQTRSSAALEEQKLLLLEQNTNALILKMIDSFNKFKEEEGAQEVIHRLCEKCRNNLHRFRFSVKEDDPPKDEYNLRLAQGAKEVFTTLIGSQSNIHLVKKVVQFAYNILHLIYQKRMPDQRDWFTPFFYIQLTKEEYLILHLSNLVDYGMPLSNDIKWHSNATSLLVEMMYPTNDSHEDRKLNIGMLTDALNELRHRF